jgi:hypothetical protein
MCGSMESMTETPESRAEPTTAAEQARYGDRYERTNRLGQVLAWVGIIAGVVFIVAVIFFFGLFLGWSAGGHDGGHYGWHHRGSCSMMGPGGMMGPGQIGSGGMMGPGGPATSSPVPTPPRP